MCDNFKQKLIEMEDLDEKFIENKPWAKSLLENSILITRKAVLNWCNIVSKIGESELDMNEYVSIFIHQIQNLYEELITDVDVIHEKSLDKIARLLERMQGLCKDLHLDIPTFNYEDKPLCDLYRVVNQRVEEYEAMVHIRKTELRDLNQKQLKLCKSLGKEVKVLRESPLPMPNEVDDLKMYVESLENEAMEREEKFFQLKDEILEIVAELGVEPNLDFERDILNLTNSEVRVTDGDMEQLKSYHSRLVKQLESTKEEIGELRIKVDGLWDKLETDIAERDAFRQKSRGNSLHVLGVLKEEVKKLDEMKRANIKVFIQKQRQELEEWWQKCHCTDSDKNQFSFFNSECYNEDLFELHELEIEKWKNHYDENSEIFLLLKEHKELWNDHLQLELNSGGANRYKNRGGQLLIEEKLRNKLKKQIPRVEETLLKLSRIHFQHKGRPFLTHGLSIEEYLSNLHKEEEEQFKLKLSAKKQQREQVSSVAGKCRTNLFPPSILHPNTLTPMRGAMEASKRKLITTPVTEPMKKSRLASHTKVCRTGMPTLNVSKTKNKRRSARREKKRQRLSFGKSSNKENCPEAMTSYDVFEKEVSKKGVCRSTEVGVPKDVKTPIKQNKVLVPGICYMEATPE